MKTCRNLIGETPYSLVFGAEAVIPAKILVPNHRTSKEVSEENNQARVANLDLLEEKRLEANIKNAKYK